MKMDTQYIFTSTRLGFRDWQESDIDIMTEINSDREVMEHFPELKTRQETIESIERLKKHQAEKGFCYFAVEILETKEFIGFIGMLEQTYNEDFTPCIDIGWRLKKSSWNKGYATEGAKRCLEYGFNKLKLEKIVAVCPIINTKSENVMKKIGMRKVKTFIHPILKGNTRLEECVMYEIHKMNE